MPYVLTDIMDLLGHLLRAVGFLVLGLALGRFLLEHYKKAAWQVQVALALGLFGLLVGLTNYASPGATGAFALGAGISMLNANAPKKEETDQQQS
ncbi:MAG: hypothetical protein ACOY0R_18675 [Chloroflexota bacterium]